MVETALIDNQPQTASFAMRRWKAGALPTPHILDATWWFTDETLDMFSDEIESVRGSIVCLGTPSVALQSWERGKQNVLLVDRDRLLTQLLSQIGYRNVLNADLRTVCPLIPKAALVIADPPWYEPEIEAFLAAAHVSAKVGADILISLPPREVRPSIKQERERIFEHAEEMGLELRALKNGGTRYVCPPFEHNVLRVCGDSTRPDWRTGDLASFRVARSRQTGLDHVCPLGEWDEICFAHVRIRVLRNGSSAEGSPRLESMGFDDDVFPSCSRRFPLREQVDVWTSGNRAFSCSNPQGFLRVARVLESSTVDQLEQRLGAMNGQLTKEEACVARQLTELVRREERDYFAIRSLYV